MNNDAEAPGMGRLWGGGAGREKPVRAEPQRTFNNAVPPKPDRAYVAHEIRDQTQRLQICCATQPSRYPAYSSLLDIIHDHNFDRAFTLVYSFMLVEVTGTHLGAIVQAISSGNCGRIREFHPKTHDRPPLGEPIIESITVMPAAGASQRH